jgi:hypothetical protein
MRRDEGLLYSNYYNKGMEVLMGVKGYLERIERDISVFGRDTFH